MPPDDTTSCELVPAAQIARIRERSEAHGAVLVLDDVFQTFPLGVLQAQPIVAVTALVDDRPDYLLTSDDRPQRLCVVLDDRRRARTHFTGKAGHRRFSFETAELAAEHYDPHLDMPYETTLRAEAADN